MAKLLGLSGARKPAIMHGNAGRTILFCRALIACMAPAQTARKNLRYPTPTAKELAQAMDRQSKGEPFLADIAELAQTRLIVAIPGLKKQFASSQDQTTKEAVTRALVKLGDQDSMYYLVREQTVAIDSDEPFPSGFDANGKLAPGLSPQFAAWAKAHNLTTEAAADLATHDLPGKVMFLGETGDPSCNPAAPAGAIISELPDSGIRGQGSQICRTRPLYRLPLRPAGRPPRSWRPDWQSS